MEKVIQIPTTHNLRLLEERDPPEELLIQTGAMADGSVMITVGDVEMWLSFNQAAVLLEEMSETLSDAFENLREETLAMVAEHGGFL